MTDQPRPVWLDGNDRNTLVWAMNHAYSHGLSGWSADLGALLGQYEAAPADSAEAVRDILLDTQGHARLDDVAAILAALGHPDAE